MFPPKLTNSTRMDVDQLLAQVIDASRSCSDHAYQHYNLGTTSTRQLFSWEALNHALTYCQPMPTQLNLSRRGERLPHWAYTELQQGRKAPLPDKLNPANIYGALRDGYSLILDDVHQLSADLAHFSRRAEAVMRCGITVNCYASWYAIEAFPTHWDDHSVLVIQVDGEKQWDIFGVTTSAPMRKQYSQVEPPPDAPLASLTLRAGECLIIDRGCWHRARSTGTPSLHLSIGMFRPTRLDYLHWLVDRIGVNSELRQDLISQNEDFPPPWMNTANIEFTRALTDITSVERFQASLDESSRTHLGFSLPLINLGDHLHELVGRQFELLSPRAHLSKSGHLVDFVANGLVRTFPAALSSLLENLILMRRGPVNDLLDPESSELEAQALALADLADAGIVRIYSSIARRGAP